MVLPLFSDLKWEANGKMSQREFVYDPRDAVLKRFNDTPKQPKQETGRVPITSMGMRGYYSQTAAPNKVPENDSLL